jgi:hypothetical protein
MKIGVKANVDGSYPKSVSKLLEMDSVIWGVQIYIHTILRYLIQGHCSSTMPRNDSFKYTSRCEKYIRNTSRKGYSGRQALRPGKKQSIYSAEIR